MNRLKKLIEERKALLASCDAIANSEEDITDEQRKTLDEAEIRMEAIDAEIEKLQKLATRQAEQEAIENRAAKPTSPRFSEPQGDRSAQEQRDIEKFSLGRLVQCLARKAPLDGIEAEMAQEGEREQRACGISGSGGVMISAKAFTAEKRDMTATGGTNLNQGGMTIALDKMPLIDSLFARLALSRAGATLMTGLQGNVDLPRIVGGTEPEGKAENADADKYTPTTAQLSLSPKRLPTYIPVSNQLVLQSSTQPIEAFLRNHLLQVLSVKMERMFFNGNGGVNPVGILNTVGIGAVVGGTNGAAMDYKDVVDLETEVSIEDADIGNLRYFFNAKTVGKLKNTTRVTASGDPVDSVFIIDDRNVAGTVNNYPYLTTNTLPSNLTKGSSIGVASAAVFGNAADFVIANWSGIEFLVDPYSSAKKGLTDIHATVYYDGGVIRPQSFSAMKDILTA